MKTGDYEWCMACDGEGKLGSTEDGDYRDCGYCGGKGYVMSQEKKDELKKESKERKDDYNKRN